MTEDQPATAPRRKRSRTRVVVALVLLGFVAILALAAVRLAPLLLDPVSYAGVVSIERDAEFRDPALMREATELPVAARYSSEPYEFQHNQSFCGPTSAADVLHSLGDRRTQDQMLDATPYRTWFGYLLGGLTLDQEADVLRRQTKRPVEVLRGLTLEQFRSEMNEVNDPRRRVVVNFHRGPLFGRGHGHFSPLLGYLAARDLVLVGDVNADYRPFLVSTERLWRATDTLDTATGEKRGLVVLSVE